MPRRKPSAKRAPDPLDWARYDDPENARRANDTVLAVWANPVEHVRKEVDVETAGALAVCGYIESGDRWRHLREFIGSCMDASLGPVPFMDRTPAGVPVVSLVPILEALDGNAIKACRHNVLASVRTAVKRLSAKKRESSADSEGAVRFYMDLLSKGTNKRRAISKTTLQFTIAERSLYLYLKRAREKHAPIQ